MTEIRLLLRDLRQARQLSQEELARALNVSRQSIISLERGEYLPSAPVLVGMMQFFNCAIEDLIDGIKIEREIVREGGESSMQLVPSNNPFQALDKMHDEMSEMIERTFGRGDWSRALSGVAGAMNVHENEKEYDVEIQVPGYDEEDLKIEISDNAMTISGSKNSDGKKDGKNLIRREWEHSEFSRSIRFPVPIKEDDVEAKLENGTLTLTAPKVEPVKPKIKKIEVKKKK